MEYARPTYPYVEEIKLANAKRKETPLTTYLNTKIHTMCFTNYRLYRKYSAFYGCGADWDYDVVMEELIEEWG